MSKVGLAADGGSWYRVLFDANPVPMLLHDMESNRFLDANESAVQQYGYSREEFAVMSVRDLFSSESAVDAVRELEARPESAVHRVGVRRHLRRDGSEFSVDVLRYLIPFGGKHTALLIMHDVSAYLETESMLRQARDELQSAHEEWRRLAYFDDITGLPNRVLLRQKTGEALAAQSAAGGSLALLIIDLARFRDINYTFGHLNGNALLKASGARIATLLNADCDVVARVGTRFIVMLRHADTHEAAARAHAILGALESPFPIAGITYELGAHIGIASAPDDGTDTDTLLRKADVALYQAKQSGQDVASYQASQDPYKPQRLALIGEFRTAIHNGELRLYCQPKASLRTGEIVGAEALVRWLHPKLGLIAPDQFVPLIESTDLIHVLTRFMLQSAVGQCVSWRRQGLSIPLAVNLSTHNLLAPDLADNLRGLLLASDAEAEWIELEITESSLMQNPATCIEALDRLSKMGLRLFVDDFGTGYSSLSYLTKLPVDVLKIDHGFTMEMTRDKRAATIVKSTIDLAHNLGMSVVAEGTADQEIWNALSELDCDEAQGHFISPPIPADDFMNWLSTSRRLPLQGIAPHVR
jgi:diguanylate cyclase (GGDEF)-like protein/PAS domain S-box-containing protein